MTATTVRCIVNHRHWDTHTHTHTHTRLRTHTYRHIKTHRACQRLCLSLAHRWMKTGCPPFARRQDLMERCVGRLCWIWLCSDNPNPTLHAGGLGADRVRTAALIRSLDQSWQSSPLESDFTLFAWFSCLYMSLYQSTWNFHLTLRFFCVSSCQLLRTFRFVEIDSNEVKTV